MTQKTLAKKIGTSEVYLSMILRGKRSGRKYIYGIVEELGIEEKHVKTLRENNVVKGIDKIEKSKQ